MLRNSVGSTRLRTGAVTSAEVRSHSLRSVEFAKGQLPEGATDGSAGSPDFTESLH